VSTGPGERSKEENEKDLRQQVFPRGNEVIELGYLYYFNISLSRLARGQGARLRVTSY